MPLSLSYPVMPSAKDNGMKSAAFTATGNGAMERVDTTGGVVVCTPPANGPVPGQAGVPAPTAAPTFTYGALASGGYPSIVVATAGTGLPKNAFLLINFTGAPGVGAVQPQALAITDATGIISSLTVQNAGSNLTGPPTGFDYAPAMKVGDVVLLVDGKHNFGATPATFATSTPGHLLAGQTTGYDLSADSISLTMRCVYPDGWNAIT